MPKSNFHFCTRILALALCSGARLLASYTTFDFNLLPPVAAAQPGGTFGWGYSVTNNDPDNWLLLSGLQPTINFENVNIIGDVFDYPIIGPGSSLEIPWLRDLNGLYQLTWDATTPAGYSSTGQFAIDAVWYYDDPNVCPDCLVDGPAQIQAVVEFTAVATPEPGTWGFCGVGSALVIAAMWLRIARVRSASATGSRREKLQ